jgi:hypothetical protein
MITVPSLQHCCNEIPPATSRATAAQAVSLTLTLHGRTADSSFKMKHHLSQQASQQPVTIDAETIRDPPLASTNWIYLTSQCSNLGTQIGLSQIAKGVLRASLPVVCSAFLCSRSCTTVLFRPSVLNLLIEFVHSFLLLFFESYSDSTSRSFC